MYGRIRRLLGLTKNFGVGFLNIFGGERSGWITRAQRGMDYAYNDVPPLRSVASRIAADVAAGLEWRLYRVPESMGSSERARLRRLEPTLRRAALRALVDDDAAEEVIDHPVLTLLRDYNETFGSVQSEQFIQLCVDLHGSSFVLIRRELGVIYELLPVHPGGVTKQKNDDTFKVRLDGDNTEVVGKKDLIHIRDINPGNPFGLGSGIAGTLRDELSAYELATLSELSFFRNNASPDLIAMIDEADKDEIETLEEKWRDLHRGAEKAHKAAWLNKKVEFHERKNDFARANTGSLKTWHKDMSTETFGVPPGVLGRNVNENRATLTQATKIYTGHVLLPRMDRIKDAYQRSLVPAVVGEMDARPGDKAGGLILDFEPPEVIDYDFILDVYKAAPWAITKNQWLTLSGLPEVEKGGNVIAIPSNVRLFDLDTMEEIAPAANPPAPADDEGEEEEGTATESLPAPTGPSGVVPTAKTVALRSDEIEPVLASIDSKYLIDETGDEYMKTIVSYGEATLDELVDDVPFNSRSDRIHRYMDNRKLKLVKSVNETTKGQLRGVLDEAVDNGWAIDKTRAAIRKKFIHMRAYRAATIARTEIIGAANFSIYEAQVQSGVVKRRAWVTSLDGRERDTHRALHKDEAGIEDLFKSPSGATAIAPGQFGVAAEDCNCRCSTIAVIKDEDLELAYGSDRHVAIVRAFEDRAAPRERAYKAAIRRAFAKQQADVIRHLESLIPEAA